MTSARTALPGRTTPASGKPGFANRAFAFAKRAPGFPMLWVGGAGAAAVMIVTGGFGTVLMPLGQRTLFWLLLMGWTMIKWQAWFAVTVRRPRDWMPASLGGALLLSLPLPLEIALAANAVGVPAATPDPLGTWGRAMAISAIIFVIALLVARTLGVRPFARAVPAAPVIGDGLLDRARIAPEALAMIEAEDHYCRVRRHGDGGALIHYRFGDAMDEVAALDGVQVHRGAWVAAEAVAGAIRDGRRWRLILKDGTRVAVSATYLPRVRERGWLRGKSA